MLMLPVILLNVLPLLSEYFFSAQNFLLLVSLHCGNVSVGFVNGIAFRNCTR